MTWPVHYDQVFNSIRGLKPTGKPNSWTGCCPAHEDKHQSLSILVADDGKLLLKCHAGDGCSTDAIVQAMGLKLSDLFPPKANGNTSAEPAQRRQIVKTYDYHDKSGKLQFQTVRYDPKDFRQRRPNPSYLPELPEGKENEKWIWSLGDTPRILYRLPELVKAHAEQSKRWFFIVEGEKDADTLWSLNFAATTSPLGSCKWMDEFSKEFDGCNVVVIPDEDPLNENTQKRPGLEHATQVATSLKPKAAKLVVARIPHSDTEKSDVTSWLMAMPDDKARQEAVKQLVKDHVSRDPFDVLAGKVAPEAPKAAPEPAGAGPIVFVVAGKLLALATRLACGARVSKDEVSDAISLLQRLP